LIWTSLPEVTPFLRAAFKMCCVRIGTSGEGKMEE
jgi:hypothetical protein